ncbi:MAG: HD domain-containing phosphohydrolase [Sulfuricurvum sp.]
MPVSLIVVVMSHYTQAQLLKAIYYDKILLRADKLINKWLGGYVMDEYSNSDAISETLKADLRKKAEKIASENELDPFDAIPLTEVQEILHELKVHQIELEMQNEELRMIQSTLDEQRALYRDLYDLAPVGYCTVDEKGVLLQANLTAATLLELTRGRLLNSLFSTFILAEDQDIYYLFQKGMIERGNEAPCVLRMVKNEGTPFWAHVTATVVQNDKGTSEFRIVFYDITKGKETEDKLHKSLLGTITAMSLMVEARDPYTAGHQKRVAALSVAIAKKMGMKTDQIEGLELAAKIHDIGKIKIPVEILIKPSALSELEFMLIQLHPETGYEMLGDIEFPWRIADMIRQHHEKLDGSGYPRGLKGDEILIEARVLTVADIVEAVSNHRPYRAALGVEVAMEIITQERGTKLDSDVVDACISLFKENEFCFV